MEVVVQLLFSRDFKKFIRAYKNFHLSTRITLLAAWSIIISAIVSMYLTDYFVRNGDTFLSKRSNSVLALSVIVMAVIAVIVAILIAKRMSNPIREMVKVVTEVEKGNLDVSVKNVDSGGPEMRKLAESLNNMLLGLRSKERLEGENIVLQADQLSSKIIQDRLLPRQLPSIPGYDVYIESIPARQIGGDYFDCLVLNDGKIAFVIGDVSGKGVASSIYVTMAKAIILSQLKSCRSPKEILCHLNDILYDLLSRQYSITIILGILDRESGSFKYANAGHWPGIVKERGGGVRLLDPTGCPIGFDRGKMFGKLLEEHEFHFKKGEGIFLYTDGVIETMNGEEELFGFERLKNLIVETQFDSAVDISREIEFALYDFSLSAERYDDITMMSIINAEESRKIYDNTFDSDLSEIDRIETLMTQSLSSHQVEGEDINDIVMAMKEMVANAIIHGNKSDSGKSIYVCVELAENEVFLRVLDQGGGFDPNAIPDPLSENAFKKPHGRGIFFTRQIVDDLKYVCKPDSTEVIIKKNMRRKGNA